MKNQENVNAHQPKYMRLSEAAKFFGISKSTLWRYRKTPGFPAGIALSSRTILFQTAELEIWIEGQRTIHQHKPGED